MGTIKLILSLALIAVVVLAGAEVIPPYFSNYEFEDEINTTALEATYSTKSEDDIRAIIYKKARELDLPLAPEEIKIIRVGTVGTGTLVIEANYIVHVNMPGYPFDLSLHAATKNKGLY